MITAKHLSHILDTPKVPMPPLRRSAPRLIFEGLIRLVWLVVWLFIIAGALSGLGLILRLAYLAFHRGWTFI